jgi:hypothetical protein
LFKIPAQDFRLKHKDTVGFSCYDKKGKCHESKKVRGTAKKEEKEEEIVEEVTGPQ